MPVPKDQHLNVPLKVNGRLLIVSHVAVTRYAGRHYLHGGFGRHLDELASRFTGVDLITCVHRVNVQPHDYVMRSDNVTVIPLGPIHWNQNRLRRFASMLSAAVQAAVIVPRHLERADLIHPRQPSPVGVIGGLWARCDSKPAFYYLSTDWEEVVLSRGSSRGRQFLAGLIHRLLSFSMEGGVCFASGRKLARRFSAHPGVVRPVMPTILEEKHMVSVSDAAARARREPQQILFVGKVWEQKGVHVLLEALRLLLETGARLRVRLIGAVDDRGEWLREEIASRGLEAYVTHRPHMAWDLLLEEYDAADVFVMPSLEGRGETGPKVILEAMARGVPVVASRVGFVPDVIREAENGLIVTPGSATQIAEGVRRLCADSSLRERLATAGVETAREFQLSALVDRMIAGVLELYPSFSPPMRASGAS